MGNAPYKILLVEPSADIVEILVSSFSRRFRAYLTCTSDARACLEAELTAPHDLVVSEMELPGMNGLELAEQLMSLANRPVILLGDKITGPEAIAAVRAGVRDLFRKPFPVSELLDSADHMLRGRVEQRRKAARYHRMRELVRQAVRERRDLNRRVELVCKDLVEAHRRLVVRLADAKVS